MKSSGRTSGVSDRILDAAIALLGAHGVAHLTQTRVSRAAGVRQSHLTYYFPTRSDLLVAVARRSLEALAWPLLSGAGRGEIAAGNLPVLLTRALTDRRRMRAMLGLIAAADEDPKVRRELRGIVRMLRERLANLFSMLGLPADPASVALFHTFVVGAAVLYHARADAAAREDARAAVRFAAELLRRSAAPVANPGADCGAGARVAAARRQTGTTARRQTGTAARRQTGTATRRPGRERT